MPRRLIHPPTIEQALPPRHTARRGVRLAKKFWIERARKSARSVADVQTIIRSELLGRAMHEVEQALGHQVKTRTSPNVLLRSDHHSPTGTLDLAVQNLARHLATVYIASRMVPEAAGMNARVARCVLALHRSHTQYCRTGSTRHDVFQQLLIDVREALSTSPFEFDEPTPWTWCDNYKFLPWNRSKSQDEVGPNDSPILALHKRFFAFACACRGVLHEWELGRKVWSEEEWTQARNYGSAFILGTEPGEMYDEQRRAESRSAESHDAHQVARLRWRIQDFQDAIGHLRTALVAADYDISGSKPLEDRFCTRALEALASVGGHLAGEVPKDYDLPRALHGEALEEFEIALKATVPFYNKVKHMAHAYVDAPSRAAVAPPTSLPKGETREGTDPSTSTVEVALGGAVPAEVGGAEVPKAEKPEERVAPESPLTPDRVPTPEAAAASDMPLVPAARVDHPSVFRLEGANWRVTYGGVTGSFPARKGLRYLSVLLAASHHSPISAVSLSTGGPGILPPSEQAVADNETQRELHRSLVDVNAELDAARRDGRQAEIDALVLKKEELVQEARYVTKGGSGTKAFEDSAGSSARRAVSKCLKEVYKVLRKADPPMTALADHFALAVKVHNATFAYRPEHPVPRWNDEENP